MKQGILLSLAMVLFAPSVFAKTACAVQRESTPNQYDKTVVMKSLEDKNEDVLLWQEGDLAIYINTAPNDNNKQLTAFIGNPATKSFSSLGIATGSMLSVIDGAHHVSVGCGRFEN